jgi:hypothetical protein
VIEGANELSGLIDSSISLLPLLFYFLLSVVAFPPNTLTVFHHFLSLLLLLLFENPEWVRPIGSKPHRTAPVIVDIPRQPKMGERIEALEKQMGNQRCKL